MCEWSDLQLERSRLAVRLARVVARVRHQRTPDVDFHTVTCDKGFNEDKPDFVYQLIETLLPHARYDASEPDRQPRLLEL